MKTSMMVSLAALGLVVLASQTLQAQDLQQKIAAAKQAAAENEQASRHYSWIEHTQISDKGEVKNTKVAGTIALSVPSSHADVKITNSNYEKLASAGHPCDPE